MINDSTPSLRSLYDPLFPLGAAVNARTIGTHTDLLLTHFRSVTAENEMKFESIHPSPDGYDFARSDAIVAFAISHQMRVRGHTLVWHNQTPDWVFSGAGGEPIGAEVLRLRMKQHIEDVVGRYRNEVYAWDVVNEAISDKDGEYLRPTKWLSTLGEDYIADAFRIAHEVNPTARLFYNDYNETNPAKRDKIHRLLKGLLAEGVPVHGVGMQGHYRLSTPTVDELRRAIELYASLGLEIQITELDVSVYAFEDRRRDVLSLSPEVSEALTTRYGEIFEVFRSYQDVITGVTLWGVADDATWLDNFPVRGRKDWPLLFDEQHQPKPAFWQVVNPLLRAQA